MGGGVMSYKVKILGSNGKGHIETFKTAKAAKEFVAKASEVQGVQAEYLGNTDRKAREAMMASFGLTKVRGAVSGRIYWE